MHGASAVSDMPSHRRQIAAVKHLAGATYGHQLHSFGLVRPSDLPPAFPRVDKGAQADFGDGPRPPRCHVPVDVGHCRATREVTSGLQLIFCITSHHGNGPQGLCRMANSVKAPFELRWLGAPA